MNGRVTPVWKLGGAQAAQLEVGRGDRFALNAYRRFDEFIYLDQFRALAGAIIDQALPLGRDGMASSCSFVDTRVRMIAFIVYAASRGL
jgi:hypothetical protein